MTTYRFNGMPKGMRGPHIDREGPCNDAHCRLCDPVRDQLRRYAERKLRHLARKGLVRR